MSHKTGNKTRNLPTRSLSLPYMTAQGKQDRFWRRLGLAVMLALLGLSLCYWQERTTWLDVAYQTVLMLRDGSVQVQVYRFGAAVVQALPLAGMELGASLPAVLQLYSAAFPLLYLAFFVMIAYGFKDQPMSWLLVLLYTAMVYDGFFWCTSELQQGLGFLLVVWAFIRWRPGLDRAWHWAVLAPCAIALVFYHPLVFIPFFFIGVYLTYTMPTLRHWRTGLLALLMLAILVVKQLYLPNWYDDGKMNVFRDRLLADFPHYFSYAAYGKFFRHLWLYWWGLIVLWGVSLGWLLARRRWIEAALVALGSAGFVVITAIGSPNASYRFYAEVNYLPLALFAALPLCLHLLPLWGGKRWFRVAMAAFVAIRLLSIQQAAAPYTARRAWLKNQLTEARAAHPQARKFYLPEADAPLDLLHMSWATPYETLLLSACAHPDSAATLLITPTPDRFSADWGRSDVFLSEFQSFPINELPARYFGKALEQGSYVRARAAD